MSRLASRRSGGHRCGRPVRLRGTTTTHSTHSLTGVPNPRFLLFPALRAARALGAWAPWSKGATRPPLAHLRARRQGAMHRATRPHMRMRALLAPGYELSIPLLLTLLSDLSALPGSLSRDFRWATVDARGTATSQNSFRAMNRPEPWLSELSERSGTVPDCRVLSGGTVRLSGPLSADSTVGTVRTVGDHCRALSGCCRVS